MLGSFEDAEDTVQETFLRAWRRRETFQGRSTFRAVVHHVPAACMRRTPQESAATIAPRRMRRQRGLGG
ncbi:sigma factor [Streptomyces sp. WG5]|uniref:sigma factor n=1 Tax=Streptomyces sp. WG5 TaxID=3417648 RepID=UPI003CEE79F7